MDITPTPSHTPKWRVEGKVENGDIGPLSPTLRQRMEIHFKNENERVPLDPINVV